MSVPMPDERIPVYPCPFCNGTSIFVLNERAMVAPGKRFFMTCSSCGSQGPYAVDARAAAVAWNKAGVHDEAKGAGDHELDALASAVGLQRKPSETSHDFRNRVQCEINLNGVSL